jgi:hypothetical protein
MSPTSFFSLPLELRFAIYQYVLPTPSSSFIIERRFNDASVDDGSCFVEGLSNLFSSLTFCREAHDTCIKSVYSDHVFETAEGAVFMLQFLEQIGATNRNFIRAIDFPVGQESDVTATFDILDLLATSRSLRLLKVDVGDLELISNNYHGLDILIACSTTMAYEAFFETLADWTGLEHLHELKLGWETEVDFLYNGLKLLESSQLREWEQSTYVSHPASKICSVWALRMKC